MQKLGAQVQTSQSKSEICEATGPIAFVSMKKKNNSRIPQKSDAHVPSGKVHQPVGVPRPCAVEGSRLQLCSFSVKYHGTSPWHLFVAY